MRILYFSTVNWKWIKQRPHFITYYLTQLGHEVDYLSLNPIGKSSAQKQRMGRLNIVDSYVLPMALKCRLVEKINISYIRSQLFDKKYDIIILTSPLQYQYIPEHLRSQSTIIYECMDNMPYFYTGLLRERMLQEEKKTLSLADAVITSSDKLKMELKLRAINKSVAIRTVYNALDKDAFSKKPRKIELQEPNMIYIGTIGEWLEWDILQRFAEEHPEYTIYLVGPNQTKKRMSANIVCLGAVSHDQVLDYVYSGNIMLLPFKVNELTAAVDPVKLYEYLSMNKTIISAYWPELDKFQCTQLKFYYSYADFESLALQIKPKENGQHSLNEDFVNRHHWGNRVLEYNQFVNEVIAKKYQS